VHSEFEEPLEHSREEIKWAERYVGAKIRLGFWLGVSGFQFLFILNCLDCLFGIC
jgi:hypothetical protein